LIKSFLEVRLVKPYYFVRFKWWTRVDLNQLSEEFTNNFIVIKHERPSSETELSLHKDQRNELEVKADTLIALLSVYRAVLFQKTVAPFTSKDVMLREKVLELYPRNRPTPFPWSIITEPNYETEM
jgi:hypothetical protein